MPIDTKHPTYLARENQWERCRDFSEGADAVKAKGAKYLPRLSDQTDDEYAAYKLRSLFYNATDRTIKGLTGTVMRKDPTIDLPPAMDDFKEDITGSGVPLDEYAKAVLGEGITVGRHGILVDRGTDDNARPYLASYITESIINWFTDDDGNLTRLVLKESQLVAKPGDPYTLKEEVRYRELLMEEGKYIQRLHTKSSLEATKFVQEGGDIIPSKNGIPFDSIPFVFINSIAATIDVVKPPLLDLVDVNLSHYLSSTDLEHGRHFTALPTLYVAGAIRISSGKDGKQETPKLKIGSPTAFLLEEGGTAGYIEFTGQGLGSLEKALEQKEGLMASLGVRLLMTPKRAVETAEKARLDANGDGSSLSSISNSVSAGIKKALEILAEWETIAGKIEFELNRDYLPTEISPEMLKELMAHHQAGLISYDTYIDNLKRGEIIKQDVTAEEEKEKAEITVLDNVPPTKTVEPDEDADG